VRLDTMSLFASRHTTQIQVHVRVDASTKMLSRTVDVNWIVVA
jgi:hypothetical protein